MFIKHIPIRNMLCSYIQPSLALFTNNISRIIEPTIINKITKWTLLGVIFPHGITDLIHATKYKNAPILLKINTITTLTCLFIHYGLKQEQTVNSLFIIASIIHFRNDMPTITIKNIDSKWIQLLFSFGLTSSFWFVPFEYFVAYMTCIHTPNHYKISWEFMKENKIESFGYILGLGILLNKLSSGGMLISKTMILEQSAIHILIKSIVVSHIIYQETHVFSELKQAFSYCRKIVGNVLFLLAITNLDLPIKR